MPIIKKHLWTGWNKIVLITIFTFIPSLVNAQDNTKDFTYELNGKIVEQATYYHRKEDYLLNPNQDLLDISPWKNRFYGDINLNLKYKDDTKFIYKFRPTLSSDDNKTSFHNRIDDLYADQKLKDTFFFYVGKRNIRDGAALGANPTDFLGEGKEVDLTKREEERRLEREGNYLVGLDAFYKDITWTGIFVPRINDWQEEHDRVLLKASYLIEPLNTDLSLHYFNAKVPGAGFNISHTANESLVLYTEMAFRKGSDKKVVRLVSTGSPNTYSIEDMDDSEIFAHVATGGHYTFKNGTNIICEYIYNGDGYNQKKWDEFESFVAYSHDQFQQGLFTDSVRSNLLQANQIMNFRQMRKNYFFTRISNPSILKKIDGALVFYVNLDDSSFLVNPSLDYKVNESSTIGLSSDIFVGGKTKEFGMMHWEQDVTLTYKYFF
jgi:hypothetical protein